MNDDVDTADIADTDWLAALFDLMTEWLSLEDDEAYADL